MWSLVQHPELFRTWGVKSEMLDGPSLDGMVVMMREDLCRRCPYRMKSYYIDWWAFVVACLLNLYTLATLLHSGWSRFGLDHHTCMGVLSGSLYSLFDIASHCCAFLCWIISKTMSGVRNSRLSSDSFVMLGCMVFRPIINNPHSSSCLPGCQ